MITGSSRVLLANIVAKMNSNFALKDLGKLNYFLGVQVSHLADGSLHLSQDKYICELLVKAQMGQPKRLSTPMVVGKQLSKYGNDDFDNVSMYRSIVGALQYVTLTRPDIAYAVNKVCQYMQCPKVSHWNTVKRILRYLSSTIGFGLHIKKSSHFATGGIF